MRRDLKNNIATVLLKEPVDAVHTTVASSILDTAGFEGIEIDAIIGALTGVDASNHVTPVLQESATIVGTDFSPVATGSMIGAFSKVDSTAKDSVIQRVGYIGTKRYVRVNFVYVGTGITAGVIGCVGVLGLPEASPATAPAAVSAT